MAESDVEVSTGAVVDLTEKTPIQVLHVDDEAVFLKIAKQCLEMQGAFARATVSVILISTDITERRKKEETIRESRQKFQRLFMSNPEASVYMDSSFHILDINPHFRKLFGYFR